MARSSESPRNVPATTVYLCPHSGDRLVCVRTDAGAVWTCPACDGRAEALTVLRRASAEGFVRGLWAAARNSAPGRRCPFCRNVMREVLAPDLALDLCVPCQFVWFDPGEREQVPPRPAPRERTPEQKLQDAIIEMELRRARDEAEEKAAADVGLVTTVLDALLMLLPFP